MLRDRGDQRPTLEEVRGAEPRDGQGLLAAGGSGQELPGREPVAGGGGGGRAWLLVQAVGAGGASPGGRLRSGALAVQWELGFGDVGGKERNT